MYQALNSPKETYRLLSRMYMGESNNNRNAVWMPYLDCFQTRTNAQTDCAK